MTYTINGQTFLTLNEAIEYQNELDNWNRQYMFNVEKHIDTKIVARPIQAVEKIKL